MIYTYIKLFFIFIMYFLCMQIAKLYHSIFNFWHIGLKASKMNISLVAKIWYDQDRPLATGTFG
jgi:hypothetical protein